MKILVTGSASGLGKAIYEALIEAGHEVWGYDSEDGHNVKCPELSWIADKIKAIGELDILINCAGINANNWFADVTEEGFWHVMMTNAFSIVKMTQFFLPELEKSKGTVINIVSNAAHMPMTSSLSYNASKAAALMITKQMAHELTPQKGITVFSVSPNKLVGTKMSKQIENNVCATRGWTPEFAAEYQKKSLMHGLETPPEAVADVIANLINSGNMKYMSGCDIPVGK